MQYIINIGILKSNFCVLSMYSVTPYRIKWAIDEGVGGYINYFIYDSEYHEKPAPKHFKIDRLSQQPGIAKRLHTSSLPL
jgi:hypothetical protein